MSYTAYNTGEDLPILTGKVEGGEDLPILTGKVEGGKVSINLTPNLPPALTEAGLKTASMFVAPATKVVSGSGRPRLQSAPISIPAAPASAPAQYYNLPKSCSYHQVASPPGTPASDAASQLYGSCVTPTSSSPLVITGLSTQNTDTSGSGSTEPEGSDVTDELMSFFTQVAKVTDHLFLCAAAGVTPSNLTQNGVTHVINLTLDVPAVRCNGVETTRVSIDDVPGANLGVYFDQLTDKIRRVKERGGRTLVHCVAGVSRSASICIAYLMKYYRMPLLDAYRYLKGRRPVIRPNAGFFRQLVDYERRILGSNTVRMIDSAVGVIPDVYRDEVKGMVAFHQNPAPRSKWVIYR